MTPPEPKASIIILTYNQEKSVGRAIESILRQKCDFPFEIIIADDGSPDSTREITEDYARKYPDIIRMMPVCANRGLVDNYFDAVEMSRGEYIGDCAGDDEWLDENRLQLQIEALDADASLSVVFTDVEECKILSNGEECKRLHSEMPERKRFMLPRIKGKEIMIGVLNNTNALPYTLSAALYRRSSLMNVYLKDKNLVRSPDSGIEDLSTIAALASEGDSAYLPIVGYRYYIDGESVSNNLSHEKEFNFYLRATRECHRLAEYYGIDRRLLKDHINSKLTHLATQINHLSAPELIPVLDDCRKMWDAHYSLRARVHLAIARIKKFVIVLNNI